MHVDHIETHPKDADGPPSWWVKGEQGFADPPDWLPPNIRRALRLRDADGGISTIVPPPIDVLIPTKGANIFAVFSDVKATDRPALQRWAESLMPGVRAEYWFEDQSPSLAAVARVLLGDEHPPRFFLDGQGFTVRATAVATVRPVWVDEETAPLSRVLYLQPLTIFAVGGLVITATRWIGVEEVDSQEDPFAARPLISSGPDPEGTGRFLAEIFNSLVEQFGTATRELARLLDDWEGSFFRHITERSPRIDQALAFDELREIQRAATSLEDAIVRLQQEEFPRFERPLQVFLKDGGEVRVASVLSAAHGVRENFRESLVLASSVLTTQQLELARIAETQGQRLQQALTRLTAFLLVPGLVATVFGANVWLPGHGPLQQFAWMVAAMTICAVISYGAIRFYERPNDS